MGGLTVTIHQPEHLPWLGFFDKVDQADVLVLLDTVQYRKNYFQNRNRILLQGEPRWITVPVMTKGHMSSTIQDIEIDPTSNWRTKHRRTLEQAYGGHPHFSELGSILQLYEEEWQKLADLNGSLIRALMDVLGIDTRLVSASELELSGDRSELLFQICQATEAATYLAGQTAPDYLDEGLFGQGGVGVAYHSFEHPTYPQVRSDEFVSHLSVVDLLANVGSESLAVIRGSRDGAGERP